MDVERKLLEFRLAGLLKSIAERCASLVIKSRSSNEQRHWIVPRNDANATVEAAATLCDTLGLGDQANRLRDLESQYSIAWRRFILPGSLPKGDESNYSDRLDRLISAAETLGHYALEMFQSLNEGNAIGGEKETGEKETNLEQQSADAEPKRKRSTEPGTARPKIIAGLTTHHKYDNGTCLNFEPIGVRQLARMVDVSEGSVSGFFKEQFGGYTAYRIACNDPSKIGQSLRILNGELTPSVLFKPLSYDAAG